jgi:hypothetical protein
VLRHGLQPRKNESDMRAALSLGSGRGNGGNSSLGGGGQRLALRPSPQGAHRSETSMAGQEWPELRWRGGSPMGFDAVVVLCFQQR